MRALGLVAIPYPVPEQDEPGRDAALPHSGSNCGNQGCAALCLHFSGALREYSDCDVPAGSKFL